MLTDAYLADLGQRLAHRRRQVRLTQLALARQAGVSELYVHRLERGRVRNPRINDLHAIAEVLGIAMPRLFAGDATDAGTLETAILASDPEIRILLVDLLGGLNTIVAADQVFIRAVVQALARRFGAQATSPTTDALGP